MTNVPFPRTGAPALRALAGAGYTHLQQLDGVPMSDVLALHGMGPKGIGALRRAMAAHGWSFAADDPSVGSVTGRVVSLTDGPGRNDNATAPTTVSPLEWVASLPTARQRDQGEAMLDLFGEVTGADPAMWGPSMVGYGHVHYVYESGREGDMARVAFSPRASQLSLYGLQSAPESAALLQRLGPHRRGVGCLYVRDLSTIDAAVLRELVRLGWQQGDA